MIELNNGQTAIQTAYQDLTPVDKLGSVPTVNHPDSGLVRESREHTAHPSWLSQVIRNDYRRITRMDRLGSATYAGKTGCCKLLLKPRLGQVTHRMAPDDHA